MRRIPLYALLLAVAPFAIAGGPVRPCDDVTDCLSGQDCYFPVGDCAGQDGYCVPAGSCDADSGLVCSCDNVPGSAPRTYLSECDAIAAGEQVASLGACQIGDSCGGQTCVGDSFCQLPFGACASFAPEGCLEAPLAVLELQYATSGVCVQRPDGCLAVFAPVCGCAGDLGQSYVNACEAARALVSVAHEGECAGSRCGGFGGLTCLEPGEVCVRHCAECGFDTEGRCEIPAASCANTCAPVCDCQGTWFKNRCEWILASNPVNNDAIELSEPAGCGETHGLKFMSKTDLFWLSPPAGQTYNLYRATLSASGQPGPWICADSALQGWPHAMTATPAPGEVWALGITAVDGGGGEGPLGWGGAGCIERVISVPCAP